MQKLLTEADYFYIGYGKQNEEEGDDKTDTYVHDETSVIKMMISALINKNNAVECQIGDALYLVYEYYQLNTERKEEDSTFNLLSNAIYELAKIKPKDYENESGLIDGFIKMTNDVNKYKFKIQKHLSLFDKIENSSFLGGCYIIYCNVAIRIMAILFPDYITSEKTQIQTFEKSLSEQQLKKKDKCVQMWYAN